MVTTWVPELDFEGCARCLDRKRLGAQRSEGLIIAKALITPYESGAWRNHPAVRIWRGAERALCEYEIVVCREWRRRGYADGCLPQFVRMWLSLPGPTRLPEWWGEHEIHHRHRQELIRRLPDHYAKIWPEVEPTREKDLTWPG